MDSATKYQLIEKIVQTQDDSLLEDIQALLESRQPAYQLPDAHLQVLEQRLAQDEAQPDAGEDWRTVMDRVRKTL